MAHIIVDGVKVGHSFICWLKLRSLVPTNLGQLLLYLGQHLYIVAVVLKSQLGSLEVEADAELSIFGFELKWLTCKSTRARNIVFYQLLRFAIDIYYHEFVAQLDFDAGIGIHAGFEAEVRLPVIGSCFMLVFTVRLLGLGRLITWAHIFNTAYKDHLIKNLICK